MKAPRCIPLVLLVVLVCAGCALVPQLPAAGTPEAEVLRTWGAPTGRHALPAGGTRLEYATGPFGRHTWMIDLDAAGRVQRAAQVLNEAQFADLQQRAPGMSREELLRTMGRPGEVRGGGRQGGQVWSWRYPTNDCLWFQVSLGDDTRVTSAAYGIDPLCDLPSDRE